MKSRRRFWTGLIGAAGMIVLILDAKTALTGGLEGISLCLNTVIPSLFPFFIFSILLNSTLTGTHLVFLRPVGKLLGIPAGAESILLLGLFGGYPVGAQCISEAYRNGSVDKQVANRMLGFCSNAGPAFIFGMGSCLFDNKSVLWALWGIHIVCALLVGIVLPHKRHAICRLPQGKQLTISQILNKAVRTIASVCGWVVIFRVLLAFLQKWFFWLIGNEELAFITGFLELANGCYRLFDVTTQGGRFVMCAAFLGFGGLCVLMQTVSVTSGLGTGMYFPGKVIHGSFSFLLSGMLQSVLFHPSERWNSWLPYAVIAIIASIMTTIFIFKKKRVEILC